MKFLLVSRATPAKESVISSKGGVKGLLLESDHADPRAWSEAQAYNRLDAFMELFA